MTPWPLNPAWFALLAIAVPGLTWLGFAWRRALAEDPHRLRRTGIREMRRLLVRIHRSRSAPQSRDLHGWCRATARAWGVRVSAPSAVEISQALHAHTGDVVVTTTWRELWCATERGLYAADNTPPPDWLDRASSAAASINVPPRERWLPNRLNHWLPSIAAITFVMTCIVLASSSVAQAEQGPAPSAAEINAAWKALHANWNDEAAHQTIAAFEIEKGHWNAAVAHAATAFVQRPSSAVNRDTLRFALQQSGTADPVLRRLLFGATYQRIPALLSPAGWQRLALAASLIAAAGLSAIVMALYSDQRRRQLILAGGGALAAGVVLFIVASVAWNAYGPLNQPTAGILVQSVNVSPAPTDLVPEHETAPAPAGAVVLTDRSFLGWRQITVNNASGWVRVSVVMPLYRPEKIT